MTDNQETEHRIICAAKQVFIEKGLDGAKMSDIAERAGISRTALNYYYRTKENLFYAIIEQVFDLLLPRVENISSLKGDAAAKVDAVVEMYDNMLRQACMQFVCTRLSPCHVANQSLGARRGQQFPIGKAAEHVCRSAGAAYVYALVVDVAVHILFSRGYGHGVYAGLLNGFGDGFYPACVVYEYVTGVVVAHRYSV